MTKHKRVKPVKKFVSLLGSDAKADAATVATSERQESMGVPVINYWKPSLSVRNEKENKD